LLLAEALAGDTAGHMLAGLVVDLVGKMTFQLFRGLLTLFELEEQGQMVMAITMVELHFLLIQQLLLVVVEVMPNLAGKTIPLVLETETVVVL
jgi:hypothetical protein